MSDAPPVPHPPQRLSPRAALIAEAASVALLCLLFIVTGGEGADIAQFYDGALAWPDPYSIPVEREATGAIYRIFSPWAIVLILPLSFTSAAIATAVIRALTVVAIHILTGRVLWKSAAVLISPTALLILNGNLDAISALGALLPGSGALMLLAVKPQSAALAALIILRRDGWHHALLPALIGLLSLWLWPDFLARSALARHGASNLQLFPWGVPVALALFWQAWRTKDPILAAIATPLASPYLSMPTLAATMALLFRKNRWAGAALWLALWLIVIGALVF